MNGLGLADLIGILVGLAVTLMTFSYLIGDNLFFRIAIHVFVGVSAGFVIVLAWYSIIWPQLVVPLIAGDLSTRLAWLLPGILALLLILRASPRFAALGGIVVSFLVGVGAATAVGGAVVGTVFPQINQAASVLDLSSVAQQPSSIWTTLFNGILMLAGTISTLAFFHFGARSGTQNLPRRQAWIEVLATVGQVFIAITFGALYAGILQTTLAAFVERVEFLMNFIAVLLG